MFTRVPLRLTPIDDAIIRMNVRGDEFYGFTFVNAFYAPEHSALYCEGDDDVSSAAAASKADSPVKAEDATAT